MIYLDYQATTPIDPEILKYYCDCQQKYYANPSSNHPLGKKTNRMLEESRKKILLLAQALNADAYFTNSATSSINIVLKSLIHTVKSGKKRIVALKTEHKAVLETLKELEKHGFEIELLEVMKNGIVNIQKLNKSLTPSTLMFISMHANNEIGTIQPIDKIGEICKKKNILFFVDGSQSFGKIETTFTKSNIDFFIASSHKLYGPKGVALLIVNKSAQNYITTFIHGGGQENNVFSGTENVPGILAFVKATEKSILLMANEQKKLLKLRTYFIDNLKKNVAELKINGDITNRLAGNISLTIKGVTNQILIEQINHDIMISAASACTTALSKNSHVLSSIGLDVEAINSTIRVSFGRFTTKSEIIKLIKILTETILTTRKKLFFN